MSEQDADRIRRAIQHDQTSCRCGHLLAACADCRDWLVEHSPRIAIQWQAWFWYLNRHPQWLVEHAWGADAAEADNARAYGL